MLTTDTVTDAQIRELLDALPRTHYARQWCLDAIGPESPSHPHRRRNARRECARLINEREREQESPCRP